MTDQNTISLKPPICVLWHYKPLRKIKTIRLRSTWMCQQWLWRLGACRWCINTVCFLLPSQWTPPHIIGNINTGVSLSPFVEETSWMWRWIPARKYGLCGNLNSSSWPITLCNGWSISGSSSGLPNDGDNELPGGDGYNLLHRQPSLTCSWHCTGVTGTMTFFSL